MLRAASVSPAGLGQVLFVGRGLNFQSTADQALTKAFIGTKFRVTDICAAWKSGGASVACAGGVYDATAKGGNALVAAAQSWVTLASGVIVTATLAAISLTTLESVGTLYLSLTTGSTAACTADVFVFGYALD